MKTTKLKVTCPWCGKLFDRTSSITCDATPEEGDITLCLGCGEWCVFDYGMHLRKPNDREFDEIGSDPDCMQARFAWAEVQKIIEKERALKRQAH